MRFSRPFVATVLLAVANVVIAPEGQIRQAIGTALVGIAAGLSGGMANERKRKP